MPDSKLKPKCPYCGNNPVPHFLTWYNESLSILLTPLRQRLLYNSVTRWLKKRGTGQKLALGAVKVLEGLKILRRQNNHELCRVARAKVLWEEAARRGIKMQELLLFGRPFDTYIAEKCQRSHLRQGYGGQANVICQRLVFSGLPRPTGYSNPKLDLMDDKWYFKRLMSKNGLPVPAGAAVTSFRRAKKIFHGIQKPVIVKPRTGSRGRHSTTFVCSENDLQQAVAAAKKLCLWVMVEEQLSGPVYRATLVDFQLMGVLRGDPPKVTGDGTRSVAELIDLKNSQPHPGVKDIVADSRVEIFLSRQSLLLSSILPAGHVVDLTEKIGVNYGGSSAEEIGICHPDNKELFIKAAKAVGDPIVGFDFIIPDIAKSWKEQKCGLIEANSLPFINLHHDPLHGPPQNVAAAVWDLMGWRTSF